MTFDSSSKLYKYSQAVSSSSNYTVNCSSVDFDNLSATDEVIILITEEISPALIFVSPTPEDNSIFVYGVNNSAIINVSSSKNLSSCN
jgi:hypothetical protein